MKKKPTWIIGIGLTILILLIPMWFFWPRLTAAADNPKAQVPVRPPHVNHKDLLQGPFASGEEVTRACLTCHTDAAEQIMQTVHWTWESEPVKVDSRPEPISTGKKTSINNFCIGIQSNWASCTSCHAGYGWDSADFDFSDPEKVDCLICHDQSGSYVKDKAGLPVEGVDLLAAAKSVGYPTRQNCGACHFDGGGGNNVKHGDLDQSLYFPDENLDIHMGGQSFQCIDCHRGENHEIKGRSVSVSLELSNQVYCIDCHNAQLHEDQRINDHVDTVACQTCHIATVARKDPTKMVWDWSTAGQDLPEDHYTYLKIKGTFLYESDVVPAYIWYSGITDRYILGDKIDPTQPTLINTIKGDINDPNAKIWPFKIHKAKQPYDQVYNYLLQPRTGGEGGFWTTFDWLSALQMGSQDVNMEFSGSYGFAETWMYWPITHMVQPSSEALQCQSCHSAEGRLAWQALGYPGDPMEWGGRTVK